MTMYLRFVQVHVKPGGLAELRKAYDQNVIPVLQGVEGCLYVGLIHSVQHSDECISLTLWTDPSKADAYEKSGLFAKLIEQTRPYLADTSEWQLRLSEDFTVSYDPVPEEPVIKAFTISTTEKNTAIPKDASLFVRIVSHKVQPEKLEEFKRIYMNEIIAQLRSMPGCRYAYLSENVREKDQLLSITIWNSRRDAEEYEQSGAFGLLSAKLKHTLSGVFQWKMQLERDSAAQVRTTDDVTVEGYSIVTGKNLSA